jgi:regulatory protein
MSKVTALTFQKRDSSRCNIHVDGKYAFALRSLDVSALDLHVGVELSPERLAELEAMAQESAFHSMALRFIGVRMRSRDEVRQYLLRKGAEGHDVAVELEGLEHSGWLNDLDFAQKWVADRVALRPRSKLQLERELMAKGIDKSIIAEALSEVGKDEQAQSARTIIQRKRRTYQIDDPKLLAYLLRQGFDYGIVSSVIRDIKDGESS